jgi:predicted nuclease of predicted toxin-antitoxin system
MRHGLRRSGRLSWLRPNEVRRGHESFAKMGQYISSRRYRSRSLVNIGSRSDEDSEIMNWALTNDRIVFTSDLDFGKLLASSGDKLPSVVQLRGDRQDPKSDGAFVIAAIYAASAELREGALLTIDSNRWRIRSLPLNPI